MKLSFANTNQAAVVGPITAREWLRLEGIVRSVDDVVGQIQVYVMPETPIGFSAKHIAVPVWKAFSQFADDYAEQFERLVSAIMESKVVVDWANAGQAGCILQCALAVAHPWPDEREKELAEYFFQRKDGSYGVVGGWLDWFVPAEKRSVGLAKRLRLVGYHLHGRLPENRSSWRRYLAEMPPDQRLKAVQYRRKVKRSAWLLYYNPAYRRYAGEYAIKVAQRMFSIGNVELPYNSYVKRIRR